MSQSYAVFSCDLDTVDRHLQGYGVEDLPACDRIYRTAVPRLLELLDKAGLPAVMFTIARDADGQSALLQDMVGRGHEIASHSMSHPQPFSVLDDDALAVEIRDSRTHLSESSGSDVAGFRAPAWDVDDRVLEFIAGAGYSYDASVFPTPALIASRLSAFRRSEGKRSIFSMDIFAHAFSARGPHSLSTPSGELVEFPVAVTRWLRFPVYHTLAYFVPWRIFSRALDSLLERDVPLFYEFHAADLLDLAGDDIDPRMDRHPGMKLPLERKLGMLETILTRIAEKRRAVTYKQAMAEGLAA